MDDLINRNLLLRNTIWNLIGQLIPLIVAIFALPPLIRILGTDRFGVLALAWVVIGYFSLFDLGLGRALTQLVARRLGTGQESDISPFVWTALFLISILGLMGTLILGLSSAWLVHDALNIRLEFQRESLHVFYLLALAIPIVTTTAGLRGLLQAYQRFDIINLIRIPLGIFTFLGPFLVFPFSRNLVPVVAILVVGRVIAWAVYLLVCMRSTPSMSGGIDIQIKVMRRLFSFGGWITVSNVMGPIMLYADRFLISALLSVAAVTFYATPYEVVTKLLIIPAALAGVLFPAFSASYIQNPARAAQLFRRGARYVFLCLFPICLVIITLAPEGLDLWLGEEFVKKSTRVLQWLAVGIFLNSLAHIALAFVQGIGRPDLTGKLHLIELPLYLLAVWYLIGTYGIEGAAIAWAVRVGIDAAFLFTMAQRLLPGKIDRGVRIIVPVAAALFIFGLGSMQVSILIKAGFIVSTFIVFLLNSWFLLLAPDERELVSGVFRNGRSSEGRKA
ncbi:MAG: flippase [Thermodesulfobacteriota bacterium]